MEPDVDRLVVTRPHRARLPVDGGEPQGLPTAAVAGPLGVQGGAGRDVVERAQDRPRAPSAPEGPAAAGPELPGTAHRRVGPGRPGLLDGRDRARHPHGGQELVPGPDGVALRRRLPERRLPEHGATRGHAITLRAAESDRSSAQGAAVGSPRSWGRFLAGFVVLWGLL